MIDETPDRNEMIWNIQQKLILKYKVPVLSCRLRMPKELDASPYGEALMDIIEDELAKVFKSCQISYILHPLDRWLVIGIKEDAYILKAIAIELEEKYLWGSLADLDVINLDATPISRGILGIGFRQCVVCEEDAKICIYTGKHDAQTTINAFEKKLEDVFLGENKNRKAQRIGEIASSAALFEAAAYPSPGLVSPFDSGSHTDMDFGTFILSSTALTEVFSAFYASGQVEKDPIKLFRRIRAIGLAGERKMLRITRGANTHKGLIFSMGIILAALGNKEDDSAINSIRAFIKIMCQGLVKSELVKNQNISSTAGEKAFHNYGIEGIRGEAEKGFPTVFKVGRPAMEEGLKYGLSLNDSSIHALISMMSVVDDTTIIKRRGINELREVQLKSAEIINSGGMKSEEGIKQIKNLNEEFKAKRISAGGSADLLSICVFFILLQNQEFIFLNKPYSFS